MPYRVQGAQALFDEFSLISQCRGVVMVLFLLFHFIDEAGPAERGLLLSNALVFIFALLNMTMSMPVTVLFLFFEIWKNFKFFENGGLFSNRMQSGGKMLMRLLYSVFSLVNYLRIYPLKMMVMIIKILIFFL